MFLKTLLCLTQSATFSKYFNLCRISIIIHSYLNTGLYGLRSDHFLNQTRCLMTATKQKLLLDSHEYYESKIGDIWGLNLSTQFCNIIMQHRMYKPVKRSNKTEHPGHHVNTMRQSISTCPHVTQHQSISQLIKL